MSFFLKMASSEERTLYISNLYRDVSEDILYELFFQAGPVERVSIPKSHSMTKYGFVTYKHNCSIEYAIELFKGTSLFGKELNIKKKGTANLLSNERSQNLQRSEREYVDRRQNVNVDSVQSSFTHGLALFGSLMGEVNQNNFCGNNFLAQSSLKGNWSSFNRPAPYNRDRRDYARNRERRDDRDRKQHQRSHRGDRY